MKMNDGRYDYFTRIRLSRSIKTLECELFKNGILNYQNKLMCVVSIVRKNTAGQKHCTAWPLSAVIERNNSK